MFIATNSYQYGCEVLLIKAETEEEARAILREVGVGDRYWYLEKLVWGNERAYDDQRIAEILDW